MGPLSLLKGVMGGLLEWVHEFRLKSAFARWMYLMGDVGCIFQLKGTLSKVILQHVNQFTVALVSRAGVGWPLLHCIQSQTSVANKNRDGFFCCLQLAGSSLIYINWASWSTCRSLGTSCSPLHSAASWQIGRVVLVQVSVIHPGPQGMECASPWLKQRNKIQN